MGWTRGSRDDYDLWASFTGDDGWSWDALMPYMKKIEHPSPDNKNLSNFWISSDHGTDGPIGITADAAPALFSSLLIDYTNDSSSEFAWNQDISSGNELGLGWFPWTIENGARSSSWTQYLRPVVNRTNLDIITNTQITRIVQTGIEGKQPIFRAVEFAMSKSSPRGLLHAKREIILSTGAVVSPQLLMLSGIGDYATLSELGIKTLVNNSNVGQHLQDQARLAAVWQVAPNVTTLAVIQYQIFNFSRSHR
ncbi:glucose-methanol-choline oxidoreductase [Vararia minispora EC-137]|uniref:Glucose-methanol-choline oxidoreductase n=1 Tax=Vararia minispora EC-137 TaxID=1314806 RepID=A0ACB8QED8_9AGAM|nr:glucose-methanol-choline oxidoreductase [Vararia minispora EC-137]